MRPKCQIKPPHFCKQCRPLRTLNRIRTGGHCLYYAPVATFAELQETIHFCHDQQLPYYVLGKGSNVLIDDNDFQGVVIRLEGGYKTIAFDYKKKSVSAGAGVSLMHLGHVLAEQGYTGCAYMGVIPGTVGGAVRMNAGITSQEEIKNNLLAALVFDPQTGQTAMFRNEKLAFAYRKSAITSSSKIVLQSIFALPTKKQNCPKAALNAVKTLRDLRRAKQPHNPRTFGSIFKNPEKEGCSAGWYLAKVGMKGLRVGGAMVAEEHANWILNVANAKSSDVKKIIETGKGRVLDAFGVMLEREVVFLPEDIVF